MLSFPEHQERNKKAHGKGVCVYTLKVICGQLMPVSFFSRAHRLIVDTWGNRRLITSVYLLIVVVL